MPDLDIHTHRPAPAKSGPIVWSDRDLLLILRELAYGDPTVGRRTFEQRRADSDPSAQLYERRFGCWNQALAQAGLQTIEQPLHLQGATTKWDETQLLAAVHECLLATGSTAVATYETWRKGQHRQDLPPASTIRFRLGSWSRATRLAAG